MFESKLANKILFSALVLFIAILVIGTFVYIMYLYNREVPARSTKAIEFIQTHKAPLGKDIVSIITEFEKLLEKEEPRNFEWTSERKPFSYEVYTVTLRYQVGEKTKSCKWWVDTNKMRAGDHDEGAKLISLLEEDDK